MSLYVILDTNIHLGMFLSTNQKHVELREYLFSNLSEWVVIVCKTLQDEVIRNIPKGQGMVNMYYNHIILRLMTLKKYKFGTEGKLPTNCQINDNDDEHLIKCAQGSNCNILVTGDTKLILSPECRLQKMNDDEFLAKYS